VTKEGIVEEVYVDSQRETNQRSMQLLEKVGGWMVARSGR
jgi:hypothetical protein